MTERTTSAEDRAQGRRDRGGQAPQRPTQLPGRSWWAAVKRTVREFQVDNLSDWAAALTYYSVLSIFPALLVLISLVDLAGPGTIQTLLDNLGQVAPGSVNQILATAIFIPIGTRAATAARRLSRKGTRVSRLTAIEARSTLQRMSSGR